jgi:hypothetical protein
LFRWSRRRLAHAAVLSCISTPFTFQAPVFYLRLGYEVACEFKGFPNNVSKFIMRKSLL